MIYLLPVKFLSNYNRREQCDFLKSRESGILIRKKLLITVVSGINLQLAFHGNLINFRASVSELSHF